MVVAPRLIVVGSQVWLSVISASPTFAATGITTLLAPALEGVRVI